MKKNIYVAGISFYITQILRDLRLFDEGKWNGTKTEFLAYNDAGVEMEVGELLYSFVRLLKPEKILETGTHEGIGAMYLGLALKHNNKGKLTTLEFNQQSREKAIKKMKMLQIEDFVDCKLQDVNKYKTSDVYDLLFLDTEPQLRFDEFLRYYPNVREGGYIFIHDLHRHMGQVENEKHGFAWPWGKIPRGIKTLVNQDKIRPFHLPTPRGLAGFYKTMQEDYKWQE